VSVAPIAVLGPGGVGGVLAARTGAVCVGTERTVEAIRARGLALVHDGERTVTHPEAVVRLQDPVSLLVVAVKAYDLDEALGRVEPSALRGAVVLPLLNGLEHVERIRASEVLSHAAGAAVVAGSIGRVEAYAAEPGVVVQRSPGALVTAAGDAVDPARLDGALGPLRVTGIDVVVASGERAVLWEKAARLAVLAAATVASGLTVGALRADPAWRAGLRKALDEACAVAAAEGVRLDAAALWAIFDALPAELTTSTERDARAGRSTELDAITGSVVRAGDRLAVATPTLDGLLEEARCRAP
jgi:2-dehydropantoate 2-reductase